MKEEKRMKGPADYSSWPIGAFVIAAVVIGCASVQEPAQPQKQAVVQPPATAKKEEAKAEKPAAQQEATARKEAEKVSKKKAVEVEGVISSVGQRTITFQHERKGKVREEVVGVDEKTDIQKGGNRVKLRDLQETDKALINYEPEAYTPAISVKVVGKGEIKKAGGED